VTAAAPGGAQVSKRHAAAKPKATQAPSRSLDAAVRGMCTTAALRDALGDSRLTAAQRAQIRAVLAAAPAAICAPAAGHAVKAAPAAETRKGCRLSDLSATAANASLPASVRTQARQALARARKAGMTTVCAGPPQHGKPTKSRPLDPKACSMETYTRALRDPRLSADQKAKVQSYLDLLRAQGRSQPYC
jgi:hypothetical protein